MSPLAKIASLSALASEKAAGRGNVAAAAAAVHVGLGRRSNATLHFVPPSCNNCNCSDNVVGLRDGAVWRGLEV